MSIAQGRLQHDAVAGVGLDREGKRSLRRKHTGRRGRHRREIVHIDENVGSKNEVIKRMRVRLGIEETPEVINGQPIVEPLLARLGNHGRR